MKAYEVRIMQAGQVFVVVVSGPVIQDVVPTVNGPRPRRVLLGGLETRELAQTAAAAAAMAYADAGLDVRLKT